jgi:hypothetical protein
VWEQIHRGRASSYRDIQDVTRRFCSRIKCEWLEPRISSASLFLTQWFFLSLVDLCILPFQCPSKEVWEKGIKKDRKTHTTAAAVSFAAGVFFQSPRQICGAIPALVKRLCHGSSRMGSSVW